jgi:hypothetical protein
MDVARPSVQLLLLRGALLGTVHAPLFALAGWIFEGDPFAALVFAVLGVCVGVVSVGVEGAAIAIERRVKTPWRSFAALALASIACWGAVWLQAAYIVGLVRNRSLAGGFAFALEILGHAMRYPLGALWAVVPLAWPYAVEQALRSRVPSLSRRTLLAALLSAALSTASICCVLATTNPFDRRLAWLQIAGSATIASALPVSFVLAERLRARFQREV